MSSLFERKIKKVTTPPNISKYLSDSDYFDATTNVEKIEQFHFDAIREISQRAYENNEFYKKKMDAAGVLPQDIKSLSDLVKLPLLTKDELRGKPYILLTCKKEDIALVQVSTGTSGGEEIYMMYTWNDYYLHDLAPRYPKLFPIDPEDVCLNALPYEIVQLVLPFTKHLLRDVRQLSFLQEKEGRILPRKKQ